MHSLASYWWFKLVDVASYKMGHFLNSLHLYVFGCSSGPSCLLIDSFVLCFWYPTWARVPPFRLCSSLVHSLPHLLLFITFSFFSFLIHFTYFLLLSIRSLSTRIVPLRFQAWGRRRRPNLGLVCFVLWLCYLYCLVKIYSGILLYLVWTKRRPGLRLIYCWPSFTG